MEETSPKLQAHVREFSFSDWVSTRPDFGSFCYTVLAILGVALFIHDIVAGGSLVIASIVVVVSVFMEGRCAAAMRGEFRA